MIEKFSIFKKRIGIKSKKCAKKLEIQKVWKKVLQPSIDIKRPRGVNNVTMATVTYGTITVNYNVTGW